MNHSTDNNRDPIVHKSRAIIFTIIAALLLLVANSAFWFNRRVFNTENFTALVTQALASPESADALAKGISTRLLQNRPLLMQTLDDPLNKMIGGILNSSVAQNALNTAVSRLQTAMTSPHPQSITIDLTGVKDFLSAIINIANRPGGGNGGQPAINPGDIPDQITLLDASRLPNIYALGSTLLWVGPLAFILAVILLVVPLWQNRKNRSSLQNILLLEGVAIILAGLLGFMIGPIFKPAILANVSDPNIRIVADNIYSAFVRTFNQQTWWLFVVGGGFLVIAAVLSYRNRKMLRS